MGKISLKLEVHYCENIQYGDKSFTTYREDTIFLPEQFTYQELETLPEFKFVKRMLRKKDVYVALIKTTEQKGSIPRFLFTPICKFNSEVNGTVTRIHWYDKENCYFNSGTVITIDKAICEIMDNMYNCQDWNKEAD